MFAKIFKWGRKKQEIRPTIQIGRYSDNNKSVERTTLWADAENLFKEKKYYESIASFFQYLKDDTVNNVVFERNGTHFKFEIYQGSKVVRGTGNSKHLHAKVVLAKMSQPSVPVMRRLLEQNYNLYYSRYSLNNEKLSMQFDSDIDSANPNKLYYALKELATMADKQDDLLVQDFHLLEKLDSDHIEEISAAEKETKYTFLQKWIDETLKTVRALDAEKYPGGISYLLLALLYRIDFLLTPEGSLMNEIEKIQAIYFKKDNLSSVEKNSQMIGAIEKLQQKPKEDIFKNLFRSVSTFSIRAPKNYSAVTEAITNANKSLTWYRDNKYPDIARQIAEYGISFSQYSYSLPRPLTEFFQLFMEVNYSDYFAALGFKEQYYDAASGRFRQEDIEDAAEEINRKWKKKFPHMTFHAGKLKFDNLVSFNYSFTDILADLNFETA
jgi:hypothetical protein